MITCPRCGATVDASARACPYCHTQTRYGRELVERQEAAQYESAQAAQAARAAERDTRERTLRKKAQYAMLFSLGGAFTCCFPLAIVGIVMGLNVKGAAKRDGLVAPGTSTVAVVFGVCGIAVFCIAVIAAVMDDQRKDARIATLQAQTEPVRSREVLDQRVACSLVEIELLREGYDTSGGINIEGFQCDGRLDHSGERAVLHDVRFRTSVDERHVVTACLVRGSRWSVKELRDDGSCEPRGVTAPSGSAPPR